MPRKLNWNKSLDNPDANVVHEVVRSYISSQIDKEQPQINQDITQLTNVVSNVVNDNARHVLTEVAKHVKTNVSKLSNIDVVNNVESDSLTNTPNNALINVEQSVILDVLTTTSKDVVNNIPTDVSSNALIDVSTISPNKENSVETTKENNPPLIKKKRESFKRDPLSNSVAAMAEWHTRAEQKVYEVMYKETIMHRQRTRFFSYKELSTKTGLRNNRTIINAVNGLEEKKSIDVLTSRRGEKLGREYLIYPPHEILSRRREIGMKVHSQTKKVIEIQNKV
ncbi:MAG: hypothetical protein WAQ98_08330 [Blastocatellia bacterium]